MSTAANDDPGLNLGQSGRSHGGSGEISERKAKHLEICVDVNRYDVETGDTGFEDIRLLHRSLPEVDEREVDTRLRFLEHEISVPILISCMTGGSAEGNLVNKRLAEAAQQAEVPVGMGSIRILFEDSSYFEQFYMKSFAPDVPVIANLSAVQIRDLDHRVITETLKRLEVQALAVHLNPGQELFQPNGDRDFTGLKEAVARFCEVSPIPIIVKETGFGMRPSEVGFLLEAGARYVDLAGAGGTNWVRVESYRVSESTARTARDFDEWGIPTALLLTALWKQRREDSTRRYEGRLIASGGLRSGLDVAKALALGADLAGLALPFARAVYTGGVDGVLDEIEELRRGLKTAMTLTGSSSLNELRSQPLLIQQGLSDAASSLLAADGAADGRSDG